MSTRRINWPSILEIGRGLVLNETMKVGVPPSLRRLHYLLFSDRGALELGYRNTDVTYRTLSNRTTRGRETGDFPELDDQTRDLVNGRGFYDKSSALDTLISVFTLDRREYMAQNIAILSEKAGIMPLIRTQFSWMDTTALKGFSSYTLLEKIRDADYDHIIYVGDLDPSGLDIERDAQEKIGVPFTRVGLTQDQVEEHDLPEAFAKVGDSRCERMIEIYGRAFQVEIDALPSDILLAALRETVADLSAFELTEEGFPILPEVDDLEQEFKSELEALRDE